MFRVKYRGQIVLAEKVSHNADSCLIFFTTDLLGVVTVSCKSAQRADVVFEALLARPWIDLDKDEFAIALDN